MFEHLGEQGGSKNKLCSGTCKARPKLGSSFAQDVKNVSITERPSLGHAALELGAGLPEPKKHKFG
jgi:hypothetical protein